MMDLDGIPIILSTLNNTIKFNLFEKVYVVTDSKVIYDFLKPFTMIFCSVIKSIFQVLIELLNLLKFRC